MHANALTWTTWNRLVIAGAAAATTFVAAFNYVIDPYDIFRSGYLKPGYAANQRFLKVEHILSHKGRYNAFLVGSSAMGLLDPAKASELRPGRSYYNLGFLGGQHTEAFRVLRALRDAGVRIDEVTVGIDVFPFVQSDTPGNGLHHPVVEGVSRQAFFVRYLFSPSLWPGLNKIEHHFRDAPAIIHDVEHGGQYFLTEYDRQIAADPEAYIRSRFPSGESKAGTGRAAWIEGRFQEFSEFVEWMRDEGIEARFFIHPFHHSLRGIFPDNAMIEFRARIQEIVGYPVKDYSAMRFITDNDSNYYDKRHYRRHVADFVLWDTLNR